MDFRSRVGDERFADVAFAALQTDPIGALAASYDRIGLEFSDAIARGGRTAGPSSTSRARTVRTRYALTDFGIDADDGARQVRAVHCRVRRNRLTWVKLIARFSNPPFDGELGQVLQMAAFGELF